MAGYVFTSEKRAHFDKDGFYVWRVYDSLATIRKNLKIVIPHLIYIPARI
jgi:hypothetical protein